MISLLFLTLSVFANEKFSQGKCIVDEYTKALYCEDDKNNVCLVYEYEDGTMSFGCRKKMETK